MSKRTSPPLHPPVTLTIAGSDSSGGSGLQADLKTFAAHRVYGLSAVTNVVAEVPGRVVSVFPVRASSVKQQLEVLFETYPIRAVKTGLLYSAEVVLAVAEVLARYRDEEDSELLIVVDPVLVDSEGELFAEKRAIGAYVDKLFPLADLVTPNVAEIQTFLEIEITDYQDMKTAGQQLIESFGANWLVKGGHLEGETSTDLLCTPKGSFRLEAPRLENVDMRGAGCALSAAITANLAHGVPMEDAVSTAKRYVSHVFENTFEWEIPESEEDATVQAPDHFAVEMVLGGEE